MAEFEGWAIVELMGHRQRPGNVTEVEIAGAKMIRIEIPVGDDGTTVTEYYGPAAIYGIRPAAEDVVRDWARRWGDPRPARPVEYRPPAIEVERDEEDGPDF